ncbi:hypothetical protein L6452_38152 [Arctium lappa]|uniref:Uncharacterized protein n=1 Tax=Arctium lappa TaxID=4217 RepID=A0ACB8Y5F2_ARCLA|nr:hypothetical protein L6452_38152 [Arctium lappa]
MHLISTIHTPAFFVFDLCPCCPLKSYISSVCFPHRYPRPSFRFWKVLAVGTWWNWGFFAGGSVVGFLKVLALGTWRNWVFFAAGSVVEFRTLLRASWVPYHGKP